MVFPCLAPKLGRGDLSYSVSVFVVCSVRPYKGAYAIQEVWGQNSEHINDFDIRDICTESVSLCHDVESDRTFWEL